MVIHAFILSAVCSFSSKKQIPRGVKWLVLRLHRKLMTEPRLELSHQLWRWWFFSPSFLKKNPEK